VIRIRNIGEIRPARQGPDCAEGKKRPQGS